MGAVYASTPPNPDPDPEPDPGPQQTIADGRYVITNRGSNLAMQVQGGSGDDGADVIQAGYSQSLHQQWDISYLGNGYYSVRPAHSGKSLDVYEWITEGGADARQWQYLDADNQKWSVTDVGGGFYRITSLLSGNVVEGESSGNVGLWPYSGAARQQWSMELVESGPSGDHCDIANYSAGDPPSVLNLSGNLVTHDPTIIEENGVYHVLQTGGEVDGLILPGKQSNNLSSWSGTAGAFTQGNTPYWLTQRVPGVKNLWAPDLSNFGGQFHLYYSVSTFGSNRSCIGHATRSSMSSGRWTDRGSVICSSSSDNYNAIDPNIVVDDSGTPWMSFGSFWDGIKMVKLTQSGSRADSQIHTLASRNGGAIEAPVIVKRCGYYYLFVSFDKCCDGANSTYNIRVGRSTNVLGPYVDKSGRAMLNGGGTELVRSSSRWRGPGHNSVFFSNGKAYNMYHAYRSLSGEPNLRISELVWDSQGWPISAGP
ncbi:family 43 glycosylhydrolase [Pseudomaricurvus sp.]|uniref:family 43 glycosylhydrolase n=1 Tax=Pseudomaricurvus sp. TaxID=2004510 RepID=UPI003F6C0E96